MHPDRFGINKELDTLSRCHSRRSALRILGGALTAGVAVGELAPAATEAKGKDKGKGKVTVRSFSELLAAQGSTTDFFDRYDDEDPPNKIFDSDFPDHNGWSTPDADLPHFAYVDYPGVFARYFAALPPHERIRIPTKVHGSVLERRLPDGRAEITVRMITTNALTWIVNYDLDFVTGALDFGYRPDELTPDGPRPALAHSNLEWVFSVEEPGLPLPDIGLVSYGNPPPGQLISYDFRARAFGALRENSGFPEGTRGMATIINVAVGLDTPECESAETPEEILACYPEEVIEMKPIGQGAGLHADSRDGRSSKKSAKDRGSRRSRRR